MAKYLIYGSITRTAKIQVVANSMDQAMAQACGPQGAGKWMETNEGAEIIPDRVENVDTGEKFVSADFLGRLPRYKINPDIDLEHIKEIKEIKTTKELMDLIESAQAANLKAKN